MFDRFNDTPDHGWVVDPVERIRSAVAELAVEARDGWTADALSERLVEVLEVRERLDAEVLRLTAVWDRDRAWEVDGSLTAASWLAHRAPVSAGDAKRIVKTARLVDNHPRMAEALAVGATTVAHMEALSRVASKDRLPLVADHEEVLTVQATRLAVGEFSQLVRRWATLADDVLAAGEFETKWQRRRLHVSVSMDGWGVLSGYLDPEATSGLVAALDHLAPPDPTDAKEGPRTLSQRRADGLVDLVGWYRRGDKPGGNPPNLNVVVDVATLNGDTPDVAMARCDLDGVGPVTRATLERIACDCNLTRLVMAGDSMVLDLGRATRLATPAQRKALAVRDGGCRFPGCDRPHHWCDIHHLVSWLQGGPTDLELLLLLCRRHHVFVHQLRWRITKSPNGTLEFTNPARGP
jgi:hypothetical protein